MENKGVFILPQTPINDLNYSKYIPPILGDYISRIIKGNFYYCINLLDSFSDRNSKLYDYLKNINNLNILYKKLWIDNQNIDLLIENIDTLIKRGYITEITNELYICRCGKIEIEENKILSCNPNNLNFYFKDGKMYSKCCHSICEKKKEKVLIFTPNNITRKDLIFIPEYLNNDSKTYEKTVINSYITISRNRNTGIKIKFNGNYYNLDIDFLWSTYLANFDEKQKIVISGNKMMYQLFVVGLINKILRPTDETILLGAPIILNSNKYLLEPMDPKVASLSIILNMCYNNKEKEFDTGILRKLYKTSEENLELIYQYVIQPPDKNMEFYEEINYILRNNFNSQKVLKKIKNRRDNNV